MATEAKAEKKFKWNPECLQRDTFEVDLGAADPKGTVFTMYEMSRTPLLNFVEECIDKKFINEEGDRLPFTQVASEQAEVLHKYFSESTKTPGLVQKGDYDSKKDTNFRSPEFFKELDIPTRAFGDLIEGWFGVQHLEEILATGGNWLMFPTVREIQRQSETDESEK